MGKREKCWNNCLGLADEQQHPLSAELESQQNRTGKLWVNVPGNINIWRSFDLDRKQIHISCFSVSALSLGKTDF